MKRRPLVRALSAVLAVLLFASSTFPIANADRGSFTPTGSMVDARHAYTATLLSDGQVLVVGGSLEPPIISIAGAELYNPLTETFSSTGSLITPRRHHSATLLQNGKVLIAGGRTGSFGATLASAELYDPTTGVFSSTGSMTEARSIFGEAMLQDGRVLVVGGGTLASAELYDPSSGTLSPTGSMATSRSGPKTAVLPNGVILVTGGQAGGVLSTAELYDPSSGTFSPTGSMLEARRSHVATLLQDGKVLIIGGDQEPDGGTILASAELYDPSSGAFSFTGSMATPRTFNELNRGTLLQDGRVLVAGGQSGGVPNDLDTAEVYDPPTGTFSSVAGSMSDPRREHTQMLLQDGRVLIAGGYNGTTSVKSVDLFTLGEKRLFRARLRGQEEVPPVATTATGLARFEFDADLTQLSFALEVNDGAGITQASLHCGVLGEVGPIVAVLAGEIASGVMVDGVWINNVTLTDANVMLGSGCGDTIQDLFGALSDSGEAYVNVTSVANPSGEIRGQLRAR